MSRNISSTFPPHTKTARIMRAVYLDKPYTLSANRFASHQQIFFFIKYFICRIQKRDNNCRHINIIHRHIIIQKHGNTIRTGNHIIHTGRNQRIQNRKIRYPPNRCHKNRHPRKTIIHLKHQFGYPIKHHCQHRQPKHNIQKAVNNVCNFRRKQRYYQRCNLVHTAKQ